MQDACNLLHPAYRRTQAAYGRHVGCIWKIDLHLENAIDMKPACRLHVALSVATSIEMQLLIPGVDALLHSRASQVDALHAGFMQLACRASMTP